jgi:hypothetical protein
MRKHDSEKKMMDYNDAQLYPFYVKYSKGGGEIKCNAKSFDGVDPHLGHQKQCFCAEATPKKDYVKNIVHYWGLKSKHKKLESSFEEAQIVTQINE